MENAMVVIKPIHAYHAARKLKVPVYRMRGFTDKCEPVPEGVENWGGWRFAVAVVWLPSLFN